MSYEFLTIRDVVCAVPERNFTRSGVCSCENLKEHLPTLWTYTWNTSPRRLGPLIKMIKFQRWQPLDVLRICTC